MTHPMSPLARRAVNACVVLSALAAGAAAAQTAWTPTRPVEIVVFAAPGGGNDKAARYLNKIWTENKMLESVVTNKVGGGGSLAYSYVSQKTGDPHHVAIAQAGLITNHINGRSPVGLSDITVLPYIGTEPVALAVRAESPYKSLKEFVAQLKKDPGSLSISVGSTRGATNHFTMALLAKAAGIDPKQLKILVFGGGAESVTNLLGGHIDAMAQASNNAIPHQKAGKMRILAISTAKRSAAAPDVPTFVEQGYNVVVDGWYCFVGPKGMTAAQIAYWDDQFAKTVQTEDWKKFLASSGWEWGYRNSRDNLAFLKAEYEQAKALLSDIGMR